MPTNGPVVNRRQELIARCKMISMDAEADVTRYEHQPFNGRTMAAFQGEQNAMIQALADIMMELLNE